MVQNNNIGRPAHFHSRAWELSAAYNPELLRQIVTDTLNDPERMASAAASTRWLDVGFYSFPIALRIDPFTGDRRSAQLNLYDPQRPGNDGPHGHGQRARTSWYGSPGTRQTVVRYFLLPRDAPKTDFRDQTIREVRMVPNTQGFQRDGTRPRYGQTDLGDLAICRVVELSTTSKTNGSVEEFGSTENHHVVLESAHDSEIAVSVHEKGRMEDPRLSDWEGLVYWKGVPREGAERILADRERFAQQWGGTELTPGPTTITFLPLDQPGLQEVPQGVSPEVFERLMFGALRTAERLVRS